MIADIESQLDKLGDSAMTHHPHVHIIVPGGGYPWQELRKATAQPGTIDFPVVSGEPSALAGY